MRPEPLIARCCPRPRGGARSRGRTQALRLLSTLGAAILAIACIARPAACHEYWLTLSRYTAAPREVVQVGGVAGTGFRGERKPFVAQHCVRFVAVASHTLDFGRVASNGDLCWARFAPSDRGGALLAFQSDFTPIQLPAPAFDSYLRNEGLDEVVVARAKLPGAVPGRERFRRCAKAWVAGDDAARATRPLGLPLEIVPLEAPGRRGSLRVRVLAEGRPFAGGLVKAWRRDLGADGHPTDPEARDSVDVAWKARTDKRGEVTVPMHRDGEWMLSVVRMAPSSDRVAADWESTWASLVFEVSGVKPPSSTAAKETR